MFCSAVVYRSNDGSSGLAHVRTPRYPYGAQVNLTEGMKELHWIEKQLGHAAKLDCSYLPRNKFSFEIWGEIGA